MKTYQDILEEYRNLRSLYYGREEAIKVVVQNVLDSAEYRELKDGVCEDYITSLIDRHIPPKF